MFVVFPSRYNSDPLGGSAQLLSAAYGCHMVPDAFSFSKTSLPVRSNRVFRDAPLRIFPIGGSKKHVRYRREARRATERRASPVYTKNILFSNSYL